MGCPQNRIAVLKGFRAVFVAGGRKRRVQSVIRLYDTRIQHVCVLHIKRFLLPVDIQHYQCPCRVFNPREMQALWSQNHAKYILSCCAVRRVDNALPCVLDTTVTTKQSEAKDQGKEEANRRTKKVASPDTAVNRCL